jgi:hypothetical protein
MSPDTTNHGATANKPPRRNERRKARERKRDRG